MWGYKISAILRIYLPISGDKEKKGHLDAISLKWERERQRKEKKGKIGSQCRIKKEEKQEENWKTNLK